MVIGRLKLVSAVLLVGPAAGSMAAAVTAPLTSYATLNLDPPLKPVRFLARTRALYTASRSLILLEFARC